MRHYSVLTPLCVSGLGRACARFHAPYRHGGRIRVFTHAAVPAPPALSSRHHRLSDCFHVVVPLQLFAFCATLLASDFPVVSSPFA